MRMKLNNIVNVDKFMEIIDSCEGKVELVLDQESRMNLKSKFNQYVAVIKVFSGEKIKELELITEKIGDSEKLIDFMMAN